MNIVRNYHLQSYGQKVPSIGTRSRPSLCWTGLFLVVITLFLKAVPGIGKTKVCKKKKNILSLNAFLPRSLRKYCQLDGLEPCSQGEDGCAEKTSRIHSVCISAQTLVTQTPPYLGLQESHKGNHPKSFTKREQAKKGFVPGSTDHRP